MPGSRMAPDRELARTWQSALGRLQFDLSAHNFDTWLRDTTAERLEQHSLLVRTPHPFHVEWLNHQFGMVARRALAEVTGRELDVRFVGDIVHCAGETRAEQPRPQGIVINRQHTFASYMPASGNELGLQACRALVAESDLPAVSPVVLWGAPGVGKTHLLHATANCAGDTAQDVVVLSAEEFANRYQQALRDKTVADFQQLVRNAGLLLVDDLQYLAGRTGTLTELVNSIDVIHNRGGHVVVASEEHPNNLDLPERLASRLRGGLIVAIGSIDGAERRAFVEHCATVLRASLPGWCIDRIAGAGCGSARTLRGAVLTAVHLDRCGQLSLEALDRQLAGVVIAEAAPAQSATEILEAVAAHFETTGDEVRGRSRRRHVRDARAAAIAILAGQGRSLSQIASLLDGRDPSTISPLVPRGKTILDAEPSLQRLLAG